MRRLLSAFVLILSMAIALPASATENEDFDLYKLGYPDGATAAAANARFRLFANQLAAALAGFNFSPPTTTGHTGFNVGLEYGVAKIDPDYWPRHSGKDSDFIFLPSLHVRKGLGFSFELDARLSYLQDSSMMAGTIGLKWALNEGIAYAPDFAVKGSVTRLFAATDFNLVAAGVDVAIGKKFGMGGNGTVTPYAGWNMIFTYADSRMVDGNPGRTQEEALSKPFEGLRAFEEVEMGDNYSNRFYGGLRFQFARNLEIGLEFSYTMIRVSHDAEGVADSIDVMNFGGKLGADF